jgi:hypothetical protein
MRMSRSVGRWLRLPSRIALILGMGALSTTGARAEAPEIGPGATVSPVGRGDLSIRSEGGKIYLSEGSGEFREVPLGDTPEARHLRHLLDRSDVAAGPAGLRLSPTLLAGGGGSGFHWNPFEKAQTPDKKAAPDQANPTDMPGSQQKAPSPATTKTTGANGKG